MKRTIIIAIAIVMIMAMFSACMAKVQQEQPTKLATEQTQKTVQQPEQQAPNQAVNTKEFQLTAFKSSYSPSTITVNKGDHVKITITTEDVEHGFSLPDYGISTTISPGKSTLVEFTADKQGEFTFFCTVFCGSGHPGMKGSLIVK